MNKNIKPIVYKILNEDEYAREDDWYLIQQVLIKLLSCNSGTAFGAILTQMKYKGISFEAITRCRRKFFEEYPQLKVENVEKARREEEERYFMEYMRRENVS